MSGRGRFAFRTSAPLGMEGPEAQLLWESDCRGVSEEGGELVGYFDEIRDLPLEGRWQELDDVDYLSRYYRELKPVEVGSLVVAPTHRTVELMAGQKPLWLDPGMAFGTGHHETTRMALESLGEIELIGKRVIDVGAGSGILAIAADLLGAESSLGVDIDPDTVPVARDNAALNRSRAQFEIRALRDDDRAHLLLANLYAELHVELADLYARVLPAGGLLLATGILAERVDSVRQGLAPSFEIRRERSEAEWRLLEAVRR